MEPTNENITETKAVATGDLLAAVRELYLAGRWECSKLPISEQIRLWENVRDAAGFEKGTATKAGVAANKLI